MPARRQRVLASAAELSVSESRPAVLLTCEHGGNRVPGEYRHCFRGRERLLATHCGLDIGAAAAARRLSRMLGFPLVCARVTRLLVDLNRSPGHPRRFSELTRGLPEPERRRIDERYYRPYRELVEAWLAARLAASERVIHVSVHSFTPRLDGATRNAEIGLLYDPGRRRELRFCSEWHDRLDADGGAGRVRRNYPYRGTSDGFVTALRRRLPAARYLGIELEMNQAQLTAAGSREALVRALARTLPVERWPD
jgi:predicted N-formylglutamate amidohydrolase